MYQNCDHSIKLWLGSASSYRSPADGQLVTFWGQRAIKCLSNSLHAVQWFFYFKWLFSHLCFKDILVFHSSHTAQGFNLGSVCWAPIIRLIDRLWRVLIGRSVSVKRVVYTWTEDSLINCTVKRFVRVQSTRMGEIMAASGRTLKRMWPGHHHIRCR